MVLDLEMETRRALVDEIKRRIPPREQSRLARTLAEVRGTAFTTENPQLSRLLNKDPAAIEAMLGPHRVEELLDVIERDLGVSPEVLLRAARRAARPRPAPDRHPAWHEELGVVAPWIDRVPGLRDGMETLRQSASLDTLRPVVWLVGAAGSGKSARLWRAQQAGIGELLDEVPYEAAAGAVWLVDDPRDPSAWIARGVFEGSIAAKLDRDVLEALVATETMESYQAHVLLIDLGSPTVEQLLAEWGCASNEVLLGTERQPERWLAVQELLRSRDPHGAARALADRLLALPPELRHIGVLSISEVARLDARQVERLSPLFD